MIADHVRRRLKEVSQRLGQAEALLVTAGAGMSVDSGLPDYRGNQGFWRAYPPLGKLGISFERMAQPDWFIEKPRMAWAWYGHRAQLYRQATPHAGYGVLRDWMTSMRAGGFVVTSNVDGHFAKAELGERALYELHGNIHRLQCVEPCRNEVWTAEWPDLQIDLETLTAQGELPRCPACGALARPNVLMFNDAHWVDTIAREQGRRFEEWLARVRGRRLVILEFGAGAALPTIRRLGERIAQRSLVTLVRINPEAREESDEVISLPMGALEAIQAMAESSSPRKAVRSPPPVGDVTSSEFPALKPVPSVKRAERKGASESEGQKRVLHLGPLQFMDLNTGIREHIDVHEFRHEDEMALLNAMVAQPDDWFAIPATSLHEPCGYRMRVLVMSSGNPTSSRDVGAGIIAIASAEDDAVLTFGVGRHDDDATVLWSVLHKTPLMPLQPLDCPATPWIARRIDGDVPAHAAMLPELAQVGKAAAQMWLKFKVFQDSQADEDEDGDEDEE